MRFEETFLNQLIEKLPGDFFFFFGFLLLATKEYIAFDVSDFLLSILHTFTHLLSLSSKNNEN